MKINESTVRNIMDYYAPTTVTEEQRVAAVRAVMALPDDASTLCISSTIAEAVRVESGPR